ncbi:hypothetical protein DYI26_05620 [Halomonas litopenaei]|nr:hypothetical protein [Halomonas litopenaei]
MRKRSLRGVNEHFDPIFNAVLPSAGTFQTSPSSEARPPASLPPTPVAAAHAGRSRSAPRQSACGKPWRSAPGG